MFCIKMKNIDIIIIKLGNLKENIISKESLINLICDVIPDNPDKTLKHLRRMNKVKSIFLKYYYILSEEERKQGSLNYYSFEIVYGILNKLNIKWYLSFEKALEYNNVVWQSYKKFVIINNKISRTYNILGSDFEFRKTKLVYINNFKQNKTKNRITQNVGTNEKIFVDYVYFNKKIPKELLDIIDVYKIRDILTNYNKNFQKKVRSLLK